MSPFHDITARRARWIRFLTDPGAGHLFTITYTPDEAAPPLPWRELRDERVAWAWRRYERQVVRTEWLHDDTVPFLDMRTGTEIFAEAFGCPVHFPDDNMPFALPLVHSAQEVDRVWARPVASNE